MYKRDLFAQMALSIIVTLMPLIKCTTTNKVQSFYVEIFLIRAFPFE